MRKKISQEEYESAIKSSMSIAEVCRVLGIKANGGNYKTIKIKLLNRYIIYVIINDAIKKVNTTKT